MDQNIQNEETLAAFIDEAQKMIDVADRDLQAAEESTESVATMAAEADAKNEAKQAELDQEIEDILKETDAAAVELADYLDQGETI